MAIFPTPRKKIPGLFFDVLDLYVSVCYILCRGRSNFLVGGCCGFCLKSVYFVGLFFV